jgi:hypothetical protein
LLFATGALLLPHAGTLRTSVFWGRVAGVPVYFIRPADWNTVNLFKGTRIYGGSYDDREAYLYMCRQVNQMPDDQDANSWAFVFLESAAGGIILLD